MARKQDKLSAALGATKQPVDLSRTGTTKGAGVPREGAFSTLKRVGGAAVEDATNFVDETVRGLPKTIKKKKRTAAKAASSLGEFVKDAGRSAGDKSQELFERARARINFKGNFETFQKEFGELSKKQKNKFVRSLDGLENAAKQIRTDPTSELNKLTQKVGDLRTKLGITTGEARFDAQQKLDAASKRLDRFKRRVVVDNKAARTDKARTDVRGRSILGRDETSTAKKVTGANTLSEDLDIRKSNPKLAKVKDTIAGAKSATVNAAGKVVDATKALGDKLEGPRNFAQRAADKVRSAAQGVRNAIPGGGGAAVGGDLVAGANASKGFLARNAARLGTGLRFAAGGAASAAGFEVLDRAFTRAGEQGPDAETAATIRAAASDDSIGDIFRSSTAEDGADLAGRPIIDVGNAFAKGRRALVGPSAFVRDTARNIPNALGSVVDDVRGFFSSDGAQAPQQAPGGVRASGNAARNQALLDSLGRQSGEVTGRGAIDSRAVPPGTGVSRANTSGNVSTFTPPQQQQAPNRDPGRIQTIRSLDDVQARLIANNVRRSDASVASLGQPSFRDQTDRLAAIGKISSDQVTAASNADQAFASSIGAIDSSTEQGRTSALQRIVASNVSDSRKLAMGAPLVAQTLLEKAQSLTGEVDVIDKLIQFATSRSPQVGGGLDNVFIDGSTVMLRTPDGASVPAGDLGEFDRDSLAIIRLAASTNAQRQRQRQQQRGVRN